MSDGLTFHHSRNGRLKIGAEALAVMRSYEQHARASTEAGGLMFGRYIRDGYDLVIDVVTEPMLGDTRKRFEFWREDEGHLRRLEVLYEESHGTCVHLGNWHTHAEPSPTPSAVDLASWRAALRDEVKSNEAIFWVIVGQREVRVWEGDHDTGRIVECQPAMRRCA